MEIKNKEKYTEIIKLIVFSLVLGFLGLSFSEVVLVLYPVFFMESSIKNGIVSTMIAMLATSVILQLLLASVTGLGLFFVFAPMVLAFHYGVMHKKSFRFVFILMFLALGISLLSYQMGQARLETTDIKVAVNELINRQLVEMGKGLTNLELSQLERSLRYAYDISITLLPSIYLILVAVIVYLNYSIVGRKLLFNGILIYQPPLFKNLQIPRPTILLLGLTVLVSLVLKYSGTSIYRSIYFNSLAIFGFLFLINGLALLSNLLNRSRLPNFIRILVFAFAIIFAPMGLFLIIIGLLDTLLTFRKMEIRKE